MSAIPVGYKQTEVGVIPEDWNAVEMEKITAHIGDGLHGTPIYSPNGDYFFVNGNNLSGGKVVVTSDTKSVNYSEFIKHRKPLSKRSILLSINGTIGNLALFDDEQIVLGKSAAYLNVRPEVCKHFVYHALQTDIVRRQFFDGLTGSTIGNLGLATIRKAQFALPSTVAEQRAIAAALSDVDALLAKIDQLITKKCDLKQAAMQQLLTGQTRLPGFSGEWRSLQLGELIAHCSSGATPYRGRPEYYDGTIKWITSGELNYNVITDTVEHISADAVEKTNLRLHPVGTFLVAITGLEAAGTRGACGIVGSPSTTNQSCMAIYPTAALRTEFLYHYYVFRGDELALKYCQGTKQQSYTAKLVRLLPIDLPPTPEEQTAIATVLSDMDAEISALVGRRDKTRALKQGMMQELLTGRIRLV